MCSELVGELLLHLRHHALAEWGGGVFQVPGGHPAEAVLQQLAVHAGRVLEAAALGVVVAQPDSGVASMNMVMPPGEKNMSGPTGRPKNMSSLEYRKCSARPGNVVQLALDGLRVVGGQHRRVGEELLAAARTVTAGASASQAGAVGVGGDEDAADPRRVHVDRAQRVLELVDLPEPGLVIVALADDVVLHPLGALRLAMYSGDAPSTQENTRSTSKLMSLAWSANMFSMVGHTRP